MMEKKVSTLAKDIYIDYPIEKAMKDRNGKSNEVMSFLKGSKERVFIK